MLLRVTHSSLPQICPALPPPAASRMSQMEGARFIAQEGASQGLWGSGQCSQAVAQRSCLLDLVCRRHTRPRRKAQGDAPCLYLQSLAPLLSHSQGSRGGGWGLVVSKLSLPWNVFQPWCTGSTQPLHSCFFLTPICLPTWTSPHLGSCSSFIQQSIIECQVLF